VAEMDSIFRSELLGRRGRLQSAMQAMPDAARLQQLLEEVDHALQRIDEGTYGLCEACHEPIETERLMADPLIRFCLGDLTDGQKAALQDDLELAMHIQSALLPKRNITVSGWEAYYHYQPARVVSGDYCDLIPVQHNGGGLLFLAGDVSGKGVAASLLMSNLHAIFRSVYTPGMPLEELVSRANRVFCENTISSFYATLLCGLAYSSGEIEICNAGHLPPIILEDGGVTTIGASGLPLGLFCDGQFSTCRMQLKPGASIVIYTDGLTEARNGMDEEYGPQRLLALLRKCGGMAPKDVAGCCLTELTKFLSGAPMTDDLTVMVLHRNAESVQA
jgi:sigma-B regulation protein RsbU (phosphoserine phosphatase)